MTPAQTRLIESFEAGDMGQVEFFELALDAGLALEAIAEVLARDRDDLSAE